MFSNLIVGSTVTIKLYTNTGDPSPIFQTSALTVDFSYPVPVGFTTIGFESFPFGGGNYFSTFFTSQSIKKMEVLLTSASNPDGYMEVARLVVGPEIDVINGADFGATVNFVDNTLLKRNEGGSLQADQSNPRSKEIELTLGHLEPTDRVIIDNMTKVVGMGVPIFVSAQDQSAVDEDKKSFQIYGVINKDISITTISYNKHVTNLGLSEI